LRLDRPGLALGLATCGAATLGVVVGIGLAPLSCVPDLPADQPPSTAPAVPDAGLCGNGIIDLAAGEECDPNGDLGQSAVCSVNCKVICAGLKWPGNDHCYELQQPAENALQTSAVTACNALNGSHVATFASEAEFQAAIQYARNNVLAPSDFWVGLVTNGTFRYSSVVSDEPGWSPACPGCFAHTDDPTAPLHLPKGVDAGAGCVVSTFPAAQAPTVPPWDQHACSGAAAVEVLCEREPVGALAFPCGDGGSCLDLVATFGAKHYLFPDDKLPASEAAAACAAAGGSLAVLESRDEREQLWHELGQLDLLNDDVWIGLGTDDGGVWTWDDGTRIDAGYASPWAVGQPASGSGRAFMYFDPFGMPVDNTLAQSASADAGVSDPKRFVCQFRSRDGGS
jgi:hypothetical protein